MTDTTILHPIVETVLAKPSQGWSITRNFFAPIVARDNGWPKSEDQLKVLTKLFPETPAEVWNDYRKSHAATLVVSSYIQDLVGRATSIDRLGYILLRHRMQQANGMSATDRPNYTIRATWNPGYGPGNRLKLRSGYARPVVEIWADGTRAFHCEDASTDQTEIVSYYAFEGCVHEFEHRSGGNCYHIHTCKLCGYRYDIDSGD